MTPQAFNCIAEQVSKTPLGKFDMNQKNLKELFNDDQNHILTTTSLKDKIPLFVNKLGEHKPLNFQIGYKDMKFQFNKEAYNFRVKCTMTMATFYDFNDPEVMQMNLPTTELMYDEIPFLIEGTWYNDQNGKAFIHLSRW